MAGGQGDEAWGCFGMLLLVGGIWWWLDHKNAAEPPAPAIAVAAPVSQNVTAPSAQTPLTTAPSFSPPPPPKLHHYEFTEGDVYGYFAAVSEEDRKRGKVASDVALYRYLGFNDDQYRLGVLNSEKQTIGVATCAKHCIAIKTTFVDGEVQRVSYDPDSVIGSAFYDAMNGFMRKARRPVEPMPDSSGQSNESASSQPTG